MSAGSALLGLAGPVGWSIAGVAAIGAGVITAKKNSASARKAKNQAEELKAKAQIPWRQQDKGIQRQPES